MIPYREEKGASGTLAITWTPPIPRTDIPTPLAKPSVHIIGEGIGGSVCNRDGSGPA